MNFDSNYLGEQAVNAADRAYSGSRYAEIRAALFATRYYRVWGAPGTPPLPTYATALRYALRGVLSRAWRFREAAERTVDSHADMRWGSDRRGFRRILHPNGVCLFGRWKIDPAVNEYTGYFRPGAEGMVIARYSTCCTETRRGHTRSLSMVGKLFPTIDPAHPSPLKPAHFITQEDIGGEKTDSILDADIRNSPNVTPWRRGRGISVFAATVVALTIADKEPAVRQLYEIAELGESRGAKINTPQFMRLLVKGGQRIAGEELDFRDEILGQIYDPGDPDPKRTLKFNIEVTDEGESHGLFVKRPNIRNWKRIGQLTFEEAVASYNGDFVIHFHHPPWRNNRNDPTTLARRPRK